MLVDSHCHLDHPDFTGEVDAILARARLAGVSTVLTIGTRLSEFPHTLAIAERHPDVYCTVGVHPHDAAAENNVTVERLVKLAGHPKVVGIGECGLDFYYNRSPQPVQIEVFRTHIAAARASGLPLVVHSRDADDDMGAILEAEYRTGQFRCVLHCFSAGRLLAEIALGLGFCISFSGILTFKNSDALRAIAAALPAQNLLVETDAPYLAPVPMRGRRNEPSFVQHTLAALARCRNEDDTVLANATSANFFRLFTKIATPTSTADPPGA